MTALYKNCLQIIVMGCILQLPVIAQAMTAGPSGGPGPWQAKTGAAHIDYHGPAEVMYFPTKCYHVYRPGFYPHGEHNKIYYRHAGYYCVAPNE